jgi:hypothetical protein
MPDASIGRWNFYSTDEKVTCEIYHVGVELVHDLNGGFTVPKTCTSYISQTLLASITVICFFFSPWLCLSPGRLSLGNNTDRGLLIGQLSQIGNSTDRTTIETLGTVPLPYYTLIVGTLSLLTIIIYNMFKKPETYIQRGCENKNASVIPCNQPATMIEFSDLSGDPLLELPKNRYIMIKDVIKELEQNATGKDVEQLTFNHTRPPNFFFSILIRELAKGAVIIIEDDDNELVGGIIYRTQPDDEQRPLLRIV